jgi:FdrA protein
MRKMTVKTIIKTSEYHDSVSLMLVARELSALQGVADAAVVMGTQANKAILSAAGLLTRQAEQAGANDLVIAVSAADARLADEALQKADGLLKKKAASSESGEFRPKTLRGAVSAYPDTNLAVISVAGRYAADEAWEALALGLHVLLFSDNVALEDEIALKQYAREHGLLLMGPGAGTAIINGAALGFANAVPAGPVGIVSAAGTGLQEVSSLLARLGVGISQGIGTGGRDLKKEVGGIMMLEGLKALQQDPASEIIVLISKPPAEAVAQTILSQVALVNKPTIVCFLGGDMQAVAKITNAIPARTLQEAAYLAVHSARREPGEMKSPWEAEDIRLAAQAQELKSKLVSGQRYLRGLFSGGTLCYEAQVIWRDLLAAPVFSNAPLPGGPALPDSMKSYRHSAVDLGEEEFTVGRPHPMIDNDLRIRRLLQEAHDPELGVLMLDVVLGYGAHPDPAAELAPALRQAREIAGQAGHQLIQVASVTGTREDPQGYDYQVRALEEAGVVVCGSNAAAARLSALILSERQRSNQ